MTAKPCTSPGCTRPAVGRGLCRAHYVREWAGLRSKRPVTPKRELTPEDVARIRSLLDAGVPQSHVAAELGVAKATVWKILHGLTHAAGKGRRKLTPEAVREIREVHAAGGLIADIAARHGVSVSAVKAIVRMETWRDEKSAG